MREYCLVMINQIDPIPDVTVLNMSMCYGDRQPYLSAEQKEAGYEWWPVNKVPIRNLTAYKYWNERP